MTASPHDVELVDDRTAIVTLRSAAAMTAGDDVSRVLGELAAQGVDRLVIDLRAPQMLNSKILDVLVRGAAGLDPRRGAGIAVITEQQYVRTILEVTESGGLLFLAEDRDGALEALPPR